MATQIRNLLRNKLRETMPKLAAHLKVAIKLELPQFGYFPPTGTPAWKI
jgi:hypothetical protein